MEAFPVTKTLPLTAKAFHTIGLVLIPIPSLFQARIQLSVPAYLVHKIHQAAHRKATQSTLKPPKFDIFHNQLYVVTQSK
jgi:hypothetical protein